MQTEAKLANKKIIYRLLIVTSIVFSFMMLEFVVGFLSNSLALISDATHMLTDFFAILLALVALLFSTKKVNNKKTYGYSRFETLAGFVNALFLVAISVYIVIESIRRLYDVRVVDVKLMLPVAIYGLFANLLVLFLLRNQNYITHSHHGSHSAHNHSHDDDDGHDHGTVQASKSKNLLVYSVYLHVLSDLLGSVVVIVSGVLIYYTEFYYIDPILSFVLGLMIVRGAYYILKHTTHILMEGSPEDIPIDSVKKSLKEEFSNEIIEVHHVHLWILKQGENIGTLHLVVQENIDAGKLIKSVNQFLMKKYNIMHVTVQIEPKGFVCKESQIV